MNFEKKERLYWLCQLGGWSLFTILELANYMMIDGFYPLLIVNGIVNIFLGIAITHLYRLFLIRSAWLNMPSYKLIPRVAIAVLIMSGVMAGINIPLDWITYPIFRQIEYNPAIVFNYLFNWSKYILLWSLTYHLFQYWERSLQAEKEKYQLIASMRDSAYHNLLAQLNPHFLFNSLNSIRTLVDVDPASAQKAINLLSDLLRNSLKNGKEKTVSLSEELQTVRNYLAIEHIRFDERLKVIEDIDHCALDTPVPPFLLQTLVENAVKHGIAKSKSGGTILLSAKCLDHKIQLYIRNTGVYQPPLETNGVGLQNTKERLALLYANQFDFEIKQKDSDWVEVMIGLPKNIELN